MTDTSTHVAQIRFFNRYYTQILGLLNRYLHNSSYTLSEARILYEINAHKKITATDLVSSLKLDKGYLSRVLKKLTKSNHIKKTVASVDKRSSFLSLTAKGQKEFGFLNEASDAQILKFIEDLNAEEVEKLVAHMTGIMKIIHSGFNHK